MPEKPEAPEKPERPEKLVPKDRRKKIADQVLADGSVTIDDLVRGLGVSQMTVHRDLDELERQGWLRKVRGGATAMPNALYESNARWRAGEMVAAKEAICATAVEFTEPGQAVIIDDSSTALPLARSLPSRGTYTVITNSLQVINDLSDDSGITVIGLGGVYHPSFNAFWGTTTADSMRSLRADVAFVSTASVDEGSCYLQHQENIVVKRAMLETARYKVLLADHTKFGRQALYRLAPLGDFDLVVSDAELPAEQQEMLKSLGVRYELAAAV
ncbi:DeoR/GlpR family DNA-binding transcription regulator [Streptomyces sp. NPDC002851]